MSGQTEIMWGEVAEIASANEWKDTLLDEVADIIPGFAFKSQEFGSRGEVVIKIKDINQGFVDFNNTDRVVTLNYAKGKLDKYRISFGDYVVAMTGATIGKVGRVKLNKTALINQRVAKIKSKPGISNDFVYYCLSGEDFQLFIQNNIDSNSAQENISGGSIGRYPILLPPLAEQRAIAGVLCSLDDKIDLLHRQNATLEALAETLFRQWFVEEAKDEWEERKVGDIATHLKVGINPVANPTVMYHQYSLPAYDNGQVPTRELGLEILSNKYEVSPNTILISKLNPRFPRIWAIGNSIEDNSVCSTEFQVFKPKKQSLYAYFYFLIKSEDVVGEMTMAASGTSGSHQRIRPEDILNIKVRIPSIEKAEEFSSITQGFIDKADKDRRVIQTLSTLRDTLLPKLMSGEVRVAY
ncbi:restriction endonuclease subunit S [Hymenobacter segetis]|uniref:Restriction endonuclease subunit S n=1 Tax=Hymenobacter segetis TaxID=2025509 RepID=A0ABU9LXP5_9BACT